MSESNSRGCPAHRLPIRETPDFCDNRRIQAKTAIPALQKSIAKVECSATTFATRWFRHAHRLCSRLDRGSGSHPATFGAQGRRLQAYLRREGDGREAAPPATDSHARSASGG